MTALLRSDALQLRTTRSGWTLGIIAVLLPLAITTINLAGGSVTHVKDLFSGWNGGTFFIMILATVAATGNFRHRIAITERLISPHQVKMLISKIIVWGGAALFLALLTDLLAMGVSTFLGNEHLTYSGWETALLCDVSAGALGGIFGLALAFLVRSQIGAVISLMAYLFLLEPVLGVLRHKFKIEVLTFTPAQGLQDMIGFTREHSPGIGALILGGWIVAIFAIAMLLDKKRDLG
jgi:hypothetical protein